MKLPNFAFCRGRKHKTTTFFFFSWTLIQSIRIRLRWSKREKVRGRANSLFKWRSRSRRHRRCLSSLITIAEGFTNSCPWWMFYFISPVQVLMVMHPINNAGRQVLFHQRIFPFPDLHFNDSTNLSPLLLMCIWCQIVPLWQKTFARISQRMILGEGKTTKEEKTIFF